MKKEGRRPTRHRALRVMNEPELLQPQANLNHTWETKEGEKFKEIKSSVSGTLRVNTFGTCRCKQ